MSSSYIPLLRLGVGPRADVYLGYSNWPGNIREYVVIKRALAGKVSEEEARAALIREATIALAAAHPHVVPVLEITEAPDGLMVVMQYVRGVTVFTFAQHLAAYGTQLPDALASRIVADAALGLAQLHRAVDANGQPWGLVHSDVSPQNLLLGEDGFVRVADFGAAMPGYGTDRARAEFTATPPYCSPEQIRGEGLHAASDVFALGVVLRALLVGGIPVEGATTDQHLDALCGGRFFPLKASVSPLVAQLAREMTSIDPRLRPSMAHVAARLEECAIGRGGSREHLRSFLAAEFADALAARDARLSQLGRGEASVPVSASTSTFALIDSLIEVQLPELAATQVDVGRQ